MQAARPRHPLPARAINAAGGALARLGLSAPSLRAQGLLRAARRKTGLDDFGEPGFREGLERLLESLEGEARLTTLGRLIARGQLSSLLETRLRLVDHRRRHPELARQPVRAPLFVLGLPRTGTTILHALLAQDPAHRAPLSWEVAFPCPPPEREAAPTDPRIRATDRQLEQLERLAPSFDAIHPMGALLPQECVAILALEFQSLQFQASYRVPSYQRWLDARDLRPAYRFHREFLQHLQSVGPPLRWVLKTPGHLPALETLLEVYPDALLVQTHRDPLEVLASVSSLECTLRGAASDAIDPVEIGSEQVELWAGLLERGMQARRRAAAEERFFDLHFGDLLADPLAAVRRIYAHFGLELAPAAAGAMQRFLDDNPRDKHGVHRYALESFGIDAAVARERFAGYYERFGVAPTGERAQRRS
jgi:hypothetical protein